MKKILVAIDATPPSLKAIEYVADLVPHHPTAEVILFSIATGIHLPPEQVAFPDAGADLPMEHQREKAQIETMQAHAEKLLVTCGMAPERITRRIKVISRGVARDILDEANATQSDTLVIGRRGLSKLREMLTGSVSHTLMHSGGPRTIWIIG